MTSRFLLLISAAFLFGGAAFAQEKPLSEADVEAIVKKVINEHPEYIMNSLDTYQQKQRAVAESKAALSVVALQSELKKDTTSPSAGNPSGDVTIVEFFDYHCGYCKHFYPVLSQLLKEDDNVRVVFKDFPILSEDSETAAKAALAVNSIDPKKYFAFHAALMKSSGTFTPDVLTEMAKDVGIDEDAFRKAMKDPAIEKQIANNKKLAQSLDISGTPTIIVGTQLVPGAIDLADLKVKVAAAHAAAKKS